MTMQEIKTARKMIEGADRITERVETLARDIGGCCLGVQDNQGNQAVLYTLDDVRDWVDID